MHETSLLVENLLSVWWIGLAAFLGPVLAIATRRVIPDVVWLLAFGAIIALVRGLPVFLRETWSDTGSGITGWRQRAALGLYASTGLPIIVAVTQIAAQEGLISDTAAAVMVTGGAVTVLVFPLVASRLARTP
ncbi:hypothetical protein [Microbacterium sp. ZXX196]|uniref:hypothetical protein n=1 Tax=Microbacterium sp. ZXX196 TaxID=2609291 RepID=UPI0012B7C78F|nr:hypothetical protein [Microbacterium sp. ZXX196]MTE23000.1 hypothetical protein [Microbacterium sp. ZXX196]